MKWCNIKKYTSNSTTLLHTLSAGYSECRLRLIIAFVVRSYLVLFNFCFCFAYNFPAHFPSFLQCWPHDFNYLQMKRRRGWIEGGKGRGRSASRAVFVVYGCVLWQRIWVLRAALGAALRGPLLKPRLALLLFRLLAIFGFVAGEESGGEVGGGAGEVNEGQTVWPATRCKVQSASFRLLLFALHSLLAALIKLEPRHISNVPAVATTPATTAITMRTFLLFCKLIKHWKKHSASSSLPLPLLICF